MDKMPDANTAALRQHEAEQDRGQARFDAHGERAIQSIVDDLFEGRKVAGRTLHDFCDDDAAIEVATLLLAKTRDERIARLDTLVAKIEERIRAWCAEDATGEVDERVRALDEEAT